MGILVSTKFTTFSSSTDAQNGLVKIHPSTVAGSYAGLQHHPIVRTKERKLHAKFTGLFSDVSNILIVSRNIDGFCIGSLDAGQLRVKINVSCIEGLCIYNLSAFCLNLCGKGIVNTGAVLISYIVKHCNFLISQSIYRIICHCDALLRIGEADTECIIRLDTALCGTGRGDLKDTVLLAQLSYCDTGTAGGTSQETIDSLIHQCIVCLNSFIFGCLIVLKSKLKFISILANLCSTCIVDLLNGDLRSLFYRGSI